MSTHDNTDDADAEGVTEIDIDELASEVAEELATQRTIGDKVLLSRREAMALGTGALGIGAVLNSGVGEAEAQSGSGVLRGIDQIGTSSDPISELHVENQTNHTETESFEELTTGSLNNTPYAAPGELQAVIDEVAARDGISTVEALPNQVYNPGEELHVKQDVTVDMRGSILEVSTDHNGVFLDNGAEMRNVIVDVTDGSYSSSAVVLDQTRSAEGKYGGDTAAQFHGEITGPSQAGENGEGMRLTADGASVPQGDAGITMGCRFSGIVKDFNVGIHAECANNGWINSAVWNMDIITCYTGFLHSGNYTCFSTLNGAIQTPSHAGATGIKNTSGDGSITMFGRIWDVNDEQWGVDGPYVTVIDAETDHIQDRCRNASGSVHFRPGGERVQINELGGEQNSLNVRLEGAFTKLTNGDAEIWMEQNGLVRWGPNSHLKIFSEDLSQREGETWGEVSVDDGTNTSTGDPALAIWYASEWHIMAQDTTVDP